MKGKALSVSAQYPKEWKKNLEIFKKLFFGSREYSEQCILQNPEVLDFSYKKFTGVFEASNQIQAIFLNNALGYRVSFILLNLYNNFLGGKNFSYSAVTRFEELEPKNEIEHDKWIQNRLLTYNGSIRHFIKALWQGKLKEEGFEICRLKRRRELRIDPDTLLNSTEYTELYFLKPCSDLLKITYKNEKDDYGLQAFLRVLERFGGDTASKYRLMKRFSHQVTSIEIPDTLFCTISEDLVVIPQPPITHGYWSTDIATKWLPADYKPPNKKN